MPGAVGESALARRAEQTSGRASHIKEDRQPSFCCPWEEKIRERRALGPCHVLKVTDETTQKGSGGEGRAEEKEGKEEQAKGERKRAPRADTSHESCASLTHRVPRSPPPGSLFSMVHGKGQKEET